MNITRFFLLCMVLMLSSCVTVKQRVALKKYPLSVGSLNARTLVMSLGDDTISTSGTLMLDTFSYKRKIGSKTYLMKSKSGSNQMHFHLERIQLNATTSGDSLFVEPKGDHISIDFDRCILVQANRLRGAIRKITLDQTKNEAILYVVLGPFSFFHAHAGKIAASVQYPSKAIRGLNNSVTIDLIDFTHDLDKSLKGDLIPGSWSKDLHWLGGTELIRARGNTLYFKSKIRAELWNKNFFGIKTRLWRNTTNITYELAITPVSGNPRLQIVSANIPHFPGDVEQLIIRSVNSALRKNGIILDFPGFRTELLAIDFQKINDHSLTVTMDTKISPK